MDTREHVLYILEHYNQMKAEIETLKFELHNLEMMKDTEIIEALTFSSSLSERVDTSTISDKTEKIAISYQEKMLKMKQEAELEITNRLSVLTTETDRLNFYIDKLPPLEASVLKEYYFDKYSWRDLQDLKGISTKTLIRHRDEGLRRLVQLYEPLVRLGLLNTFTPQ